MVEPFMEETACKMFNQLGIDDNRLTAWDSLYEYQQYKKELNVVKKGEPLFVRLDLQEEVEFLKNEMKK